MLRLYIWIFHTHSPPDYVGVWCKLISQLFDLLCFRALVMSVLSVADRNATSRQKCMASSKPNVNIVSSLLAKWLISSSWIILARRYMQVSRSLKMLLIYTKYSSVKMLCNGWTSVCISKCYFNVYKLLVVFTWKTNILVVACTQIMPNKFLFWIARNAWRYINAFWLIENRAVELTR